MDYSPCPEREIWPFLRGNISQKAKRPHPSKLACILVTSIPTCMKFLSDSDRLNFLMTMDYSPCPEREIWPFLRGNISQKAKRPHPSKLACVASSLSEIYYLSKTAKFPFQGMDYSPWSSKNLIDQNRLKNFMQVGIDVTRMHAILMGILVTSIPTCMKFLSRFRSIKFFDDHGLYHGL